MASPFCKALAIVADGFDVGYGSTAIGEMTRWFDDYSTTGLSRHRVKKAVRLTSGLISVLKVSI